jgi:hypothetical protein
VLVTFLFTVVVQVIGGTGLHRQRLSIPVHCFPDSTTLEFPRHIDFGNVHVGDTCKRTIKLAVDIPISFEFSIQLSQLHSDFHVSPMSGVLPGNGSVDIDVVFEPCAIQTHRLELTLTTSQLRGKPMSCILVGTVKPSSARDEKVRTYAGDLPVTMHVLDSKHLVDSARMEVWPTAPKGGAGHGDPVTEAAWNNRHVKSILTAVRYQLPTNSCWK